MTNDKIHVTIELSRDFPVASLTNLPGRIVSIEGVEHTTLETGENEGTQHDATNWIPHTGNECPVHSLDVVKVQFSDGETSGSTRAGMWEWNVQKHYDSAIVSYRHLTDPDGIPYVYDDGSLPEWAEYVATCDKECAHACSEEPAPDGGEDTWDTFDVLAAEDLPGKYTNTLVPWTETLRRVYRES